MRRSSWFLVALTVTAPLSCKSASGALPGWEEGSQPDAPEGEVAALTVAPESDSDAEAEGGDLSPDEPEEAETDVEPTDGSSPAASAPEDSEAASKPKKSGPGPLPGPLHKKVKSSCGQDPGVGQRLKSFSLKTPDGKTINPANYRGRVLLVNFWGTWCKPCLKELPEFDQLYRRYRKHGLTLVAVATDEDPGPVKRIVRSKKLAAKVVIGGESYANQYGSDKFPFSFVVDTRGVIKGSYRGYKPECAGKLEADIRAELNKRNK